MTTLACPICLEDKSLVKACRQCTAEICLECIPLLVQSGCYKCPVCRMEQEVPTADGVETMTRIEYYQNLYDIAEKDMYQRLRADLAQIRSDYYDCDITEEVYTARLDEVYERDECPMFAVERDELVEKASNEGISFCDCGHNFYIHTAEHDYPF